MLQKEAQTWNIRDLMKFTIDHFQRHGFDEARLNIELLLSHALHCQRIELYTRFEQPLSREELGAFRRLYERRLNHEPVQYIVGSASFMGLQFTVDSRVLIPRPETETVVEQMMLICNRRNKAEPVSVLEIGTGCGNIAVALAKLNRNIRVTTLDISEDSLNVAKANAVHHGVDDRITFLRRDLFDIQRDTFPDKFDHLISNPPYVSSEEWTNLQPEIGRFEPRMAVTDSSDGYTFYRRIAGCARDFLKKDGAIVVEVGYGQAAKVKSIFHDGGFQTVEIVNDLQDVPRVVVATDA